MKNLQDQSSPSMVLWAFLGAIIGGAITAFLFMGRVNILPDNISYTDLAAVVLTAVTVILAVFGLAAAFFAIVGYRAFMRTAGSMAKGQAVPAAQEEVKKYLGGDAIKSYLEEQARAAALQVLTPDLLNEVIRRRVDAFLGGNERDDKMDAESEALEELEDEADGEETDQGQP